MTTNDSSYDSQGDRACTLPEAPAPVGIRYDAELRRDAYEALAGFLPVGHPLRPDAPASVYISAGAVAAKVWEHLSQEKREAIGKRKDVFLKLIPVAIVAAFVELHRRPGLDVLSTLLEQMRKIFPQDFRFGGADDER